MKKKTMAVILIAFLTMAGCSKEPERVYEMNGTPETTEEPAKSVDELFKAGDKDVFVPFADKEHSFCTITEGWGTPVRQQGMGGCYSYAAVSSMQSGYLKEHGELIDINPVDIINRIYEVDKEEKYAEEKYYIFSGSPTDLGGGIFQVTGALCAEPLNGYLVEESNVYGGYNMTVDGIKPMLEDDIKNTIRERGAICLTVNYQKDCKYMNGYYTQNYGDNGTDTDHVAVIVGWDDDFPADCFKTPATRNGAWLVQNSFGEFWGNCGYYWVSYDMPIPSFYDCHVTREYSSAVAYGKFPDDRVLSSDALSKAGENLDQITAEEIAKCEKIAVASVYEQEGSVGAVGFWTNVPDQEYEIEICGGKFGEVLASTSGVFETEGYHTVKFDKAVDVKKFTVVLKISGMASFEGEPRERDSYSIFQKIDGHYEAKVEEGRSFIQVGGEWVDVTDPSIRTKMGYENVPEEEGFSVTPGDPCITVLFK